MSWLVTAHRLAIPGRLQPTDLNLEAGALACLVGPNGSGKTSLLHALAGIGAAKGEVSIAGRNPNTLDPDERQRIFTFLRASRDIHWPLSARDLIALGLPAGAESGAVVERLDLAPLLDRNVDRLSTGERSRVLIARALAADPKLLLLDEPIANLDPLWQLKLMDLLKELTREKGKAILLAVHDLEVARRYGDRMIVMQDGRIQADGDPANLLASDHMPAVFGVRWSGGGWTPVA